MEQDNLDQRIWKPIEGLSKKRRPGIGTYFSKKRADHRNTILKDWAKRLEPNIIPKVPDNYISPFDKNKCTFCLSDKIGPTGDEFRPSSQRGRINKVNCISCCGRCNQSKQDKCGSKLIEWIKEKNLISRTPIPIEQQEKIINWYQENEKYLLIPLDTFDNKFDNTYENRLIGLDFELNKMYETFV